MTELTRRKLLQATGLLTAGAALGGCGSDPDGGDSGSSGAISWWDHFGPLKDLQKKTFAAFEQDTGIAVEYTFHQAGKWAQALQLAHQSGQLPDVHSLAALGVPVPALIDDGWFRPLELDEKARARIPEENLVEGLHTLDGKLYSFPIFTSRQHRACHWFNTDLLERAGYDPDQPPRTYDGFRKAARAVVRGGGSGVSGLILNLGMTDRVEAQVHDLAQAAGFEGLLGVEFRSGDFAFHADPYMAVMDFLQALQRDKLLAPISANLNGKQARARWATGVACSFIDGPWCAGVVAQDLKAFSKKLEVGPILRPDTGSPGVTYRPPKGGTFWLSSQGDHPGPANRLLGRLTKTKYLRGVASNMDQPPYDLGVVQEADVLPAYRKLMAMFSEQVFLAPLPVGNNVEVAKAQAETGDVNPGLGELVQGMLGGDVTNIRRELTKLSDKNARERERALAKAKKKGAKTSLEDFAFPNWKAGADFTKDMY